MTADHDTILDDLFHGWAIAALVEQAIARGAWPESGAIRRTAYGYYETALAFRDDSQD